MTHRLPLSLSHNPARWLPLGSLCAVVTATFSIVMIGTASGDRPPANMAAVRAAEQSLASALHHDGGVQTGRALRAARATMTAIDAASAAGMSPRQRRSLAARRALVEAIGSTLRNPRSRLAGRLEHDHREAVRAADAAGVPLADLRWTPRRA